MSLNEKQKRFVLEYLIDLNATQAAIRAGYSKKTAYSMGQQNLKKPEIQKAIQAKQNKLQHKLEITQERVLGELAQVAFAKASDQTISDLKYTNKLKALELLGKYLSLFEPKQAKANDTEDDPITQALKEEAEHGIQ